MLIYCKITSPEELWSNQWIPMNRKECCMENKKRKKLNKFHESVYFTTVILFAPSWVFFSQLWHSKYKQSQVVEHLTLHFRRLQSCNTTDLPPFSQPGGWCVSAVHGIIPASLQDTWRQNLQREGQVRVWHLLLHSYRSGEVLWSTLRMPGLGLCHV